MTQINSIHLQNALDFITKLDNRDYTALAATMAPDCTHRFLPATLGGLGKPVRGKEELIEFAKGLESIFETINFQSPLEITETKDAVILHMASDGKTRSGKPYNNEYMYTFRFNAEGKILSVQEFLDSHYVLDILAGEKDAA